MTTRQFLLVATLAAAVSSIAHGTTYYVAPGGRNSNPGTKQNPFRTIQKAANVMKPGDTCLIREGIYRETVRPARSGVPSQPIRFEAYPNEMAVVSGAESLLEWRTHEGHIYKTKVKWPVEQVFVDGQMMIEARWPNTGLDLLHQNYAWCEEGTTAERVVDSHITQPDGYWNGAVMWIDGGTRAKACTTRILRHEGNKLHIEITDMTRFGRKADWSRTAYDPRDGNPYYLTRGPLSTLDCETEWWLDRSSFELYLWLPGSAKPKEHLIEAKKRDLAFDLRGLSHIELNGISVFAARIDMSGCTKCIVDDCHLSYLSHVAVFKHINSWDAGRFDTGLMIGGSDNEVRNCTIAYSAGNGIGLQKDSIRILIANCLIHDVNYAGLDCAAVNGYGYDHTVRGNTMFNTGDSAIIQRSFLASRIEYNHMYNVGLVNHDMGITYTYGDGKGTVIAYNWCHDNFGGSGIYLDNGSRNFLVHHNVVWNVLWNCIQMNMPNNNSRVYNNTVLGGSAISGVGPPGKLKELNMAGTHIVNNIFVGRMWTDSGGKLPPGAMFGDNLEIQDAKLLDPENYDFRLTPDSPAVDAGRAISGITDGHSGKSPDVGAYEQGAKWKAGCALTERGIKANGGQLLLPPASIHTKKGGNFYYEQSQIRDPCLLYHGGNRDRRSCQSSE
ncbi:MAG: right-handed parallel beta-helix repeat-containing protein [Armatimonadetes bacterium]|nr:right-handed parallel beta-helix repeat-containing protein [Armatimonadota bacterium]